MRGPAATRGFTDCVAYASCRLSAAMPAAAAPPRADALLTFIKFSLTLNKADSRLYCRHRRLDSIHIWQPQAFARSTSARSSQLSAQMLADDLGEQRTYPARNAPHLAISHAR